MKYRSEYIEIERVKEMEVTKVWNRRYRWKWNGVDWECRWMERKGVSKVKSIIDVGG